MFEDVLGRQHVTEFDVREESIKQNLRSGGGLMHSKKRHQNI
jgi:hypothetical protein